MAMLNMVLTMMMMMMMTMMGRSENGRQLSGLISWASAAPQ